MRLSRKEGIKLSIRMVFIKVYLIFYFFMLIFLLCIILYYDGIKFIILYLCFYGVYGYEG